MIKVPKIENPSIVARDAAGVVAVASIAVGAGMVYLPAGFIVAGVLVLAGVIAAARGDATVVSKP